MNEAVGDKQDTVGVEGEAAAGAHGPVGEPGAPAQHALSGRASRPSSPGNCSDVDMVSVSSSAASVGAAQLNTARKSTGGLPPPAAASAAARTRPTARKSMGSRQESGSHGTSSAPSSRSASPASLGAPRGTARKSTGGRRAQGPIRSPSLPSSSSASGSDDADSDSSTSSSARAESASRPQPVRAAASPSLALTDSSMSNTSTQRPAAPVRATARKSLGGRAPVKPSSTAKSAEPPSAASAAKRKPPPSPASSTTSADVPHKKRRRCADDDIVAAKEAGQLGSRRRLRKSRAGVEQVVVEQVVVEQVVVEQVVVEQVVVEQAAPLVLEPDTVVAGEMGDEGKIDELEAKIEQVRPLPLLLALSGIHGLMPLLPLQIKLVEASERPWNRLIAGPSFNVDAEFDISIQNDVNRRERRWARRHPDEHPLREGYKTLFELMVLEANAKEYSPHEPARRPKIRVLPPTGQSAHHWSCPPFEFIYTNRCVPLLSSSPLGPLLGAAADLSSSRSRAASSTRTASVRSRRPAATARATAARRATGRGARAASARSSRRALVQEATSARAMATLHTSTAGSSTPSSTSRSPSCASLCAVSVPVEKRRQADLVVRSECNSECGCGPKCINRVRPSFLSLSPRRRRSPLSSSCAQVVGLRPSVSVDIFHTGRNGWGASLPLHPHAAAPTR